MSEPRNPEEQYEDNLDATFVEVREAARSALYTERGLPGIIGSVLQAYSQEMQALATQVDSAMPVTKEEQETLEQQLEIVETEHDVLLMLHEAFNRMETEHGGVSAVQLAKTYGNALTQEVLEGCLENHSVSDMVQYLQNAAGRVRDQTDAALGLDERLTSGIRPQDVAESERRRIHRFQNEVLRRQMQGLMALLEGMKPSVGFMEQATRASAERFLAAERAVPATSQA